MKYIIYTTADKYKHIIFMTTKMKEMCAYTGKSSDYIRSTIYGYKTGRIKSCRFEYVWLDD